MKKTCKHCGTRYAPSEGQGDFCCSGCEHVYGLIQSGGFGDYYKQQDRAGRPVGDGPFEEQKFVSIKQIQEDAESGDGAPHVTLGVQGMSCMGCVWLVEHLARRQSGVVSAKVALSSNQMSLSWKSGRFDLPALARELHGFGYLLSGAASAFSISPLAMRVLLTAVFCLNGLFLSLLLTSGFATEVLSSFLELLVFACSAFALFVGGSLFFLPAWRGMQLKRFHSDLVPSAVLVALFGYALLPIVSAQLWSPQSSAFFVVLPTLVLGRWLAEFWMLRQEGN